jgi:hypothetical protein
MAVVIDSGPITAVDLVHHVPRQKWRELMLARRRFCEINLSYDCRCLVQFINDAETMFAELGFKSPDDMILNGYRLEPEEINIAVAWLKLNPSDGPLPLDHAVKLGRHGGNRKSEEAKKYQDRNPILKRRGRDYDLARLRRDRPDLAERVEAGEVSANAAAIEAGFRRKPTPYEQVLKLLPKLTDAEWQAVMRARRKDAA